MPPETEIDTTPVVEAVPDEPPSEDTDPLVAFGSEVKALGNGKIGGWLVKFGDSEHTDLEGEFFDADTDFGLDWDDTNKSNVYFNHGLDPEVGKRRFDRATLTKRDAGIWIEGILKERDDYEKMIKERLIDQHKAGWSSGTLPHLVERERVGKAVRIKSWSLGGDASITHIPAEPTNMVVSLKSLPFVPLKSLTPQPTQPKATPQAPTVQGSAAPGGQRETKAKITVTENDDMPENMEERLTTLEDGMKKIDILSEMIEKYLKYIEETPALKNSGYVSQDGGNADPNVNSFGDFLKAIQRGDELRLAKHYKSVKALNEGDGTAGGFLVPEEYNRELLQLTVDQSEILSLVPRQPVSSNSGKYPALDNYITPAAGSGETAGAAGVKGVKRAEGGAYAETEPKFVEIEYKINDAISGHTKVTAEFQADSAFGIEQLLKNLFAIADGAKQEYYLLQGNGIGEPLGILNANNNAMVDVDSITDNVFEYPDALAMVARFKLIKAAKTRWVRHMSMIPDFGNLKVGASSPAVLQVNLAGKIVEVLLGYGITNSEHMAQADATGCVALIDFGGYMFFDRGGMYIDFSEHADFLNRRNVWRFGRRMDGQPWVKNKITLSSPGAAYTISPFIRFTD